VNWFAELGRIFSSGFSGPVIGWPALVHFAAIAMILRTAGRTLKSRMATPREELDVEETAPEGAAHHSLIPIWRPNYFVPRIAPHQDAIEWKDYHFTLGGADMMNGKWALAFGAMTMLALIGIPAAISAWAGEPNGLFSCLGFLMLITVVGPLANLVYMANRLWMQEIRERTLGSLMLLPMTAKEIIHAKLRTFARMCLPEIILYAVQLAIVAGICAAVRVWAPLCLFLGLLLSIPMIVCTDAAWRLIPRGLTGIRARTGLVLSVMGAWLISLALGCGGTPFIGVILLAGCVPFVCRFAIDIAAEALASHAGELTE
jgi:hypothetical protein